MVRKRRIHYTETDKAVMWDRWQKAILWRRSHNFLTVAMARSPAFSCKRVEYGHPRESGPTGRCHWPNVKRSRVVLLLAAHYVRLRLH